MTNQHDIQPLSVDPEGEFPFAASDYAVHLLTAIHQFRDTALESRLKTIGLNVGRYRVLAVLNRFGACTMTELSQFTAVDRTTLTRVADQLVKEGLAERQSATRDRRQVLLWPTAKGLGFYLKALDMVLDLNRRIMRGVPEPDQRVTVRALKLMLENLAPDEESKHGILHFNRVRPSGDPAPTLSIAGAPTARSSARKPSS